LEKPLKDERKLETADCRTEPKPTSPARELKPKDDDSTRGFMVLATDY